MSTLASNRKQPAAAANLACKQPFGQNHSRSRPTTGLSGILAPMKIPKRLQPLVDDGVIDSVVRQLMSGKEAMVFVVRCGTDTRCAKVYKEADKRSFRQAVASTENRTTKNSG